jgi:hypothetical protein
MGDSIGEGVQSADASAATQPSSYLNWVAFKIGVPFALPLIQTGPFAVVGDTDQRSRLFPAVPPANLSVSGADVSSLLDDTADATNENEINSETDLVLFPYLGSQMEVAEFLNPLLIICWIGNNDVLSAVTSFDQLDASQMTSVAQFEERFTELVERLGNLDSVVVLANIPDVTNIAFLVDGEDLVKFVGSDFGLPEGDYTTLPALLLIKLGLDDGSLLQDPNFILDSSEVQQVRERTQAFNQIIAETAAGIGAPVLDVNSIFGQFASSPPVVGTIPLTTRFLGGLFSLDGVHPSNIGHLLLADSMLWLINSSFGTSFPAVTESEYMMTFFTDPFLDKDQDGRVAGRPFAGLLETIGWLLGITGDENDLEPDVPLTQYGAELSGTENAEGVGEPIDRQQLIQAFKKIWPARPQ